MVRFLRQSPFLCLCVFINTLQLVECDKQFLLFVYTLCFLGEVYVSEKKIFINKERWGRKMRDNNIPLTEARYIYNTESVIKELKINYFAFGGYIFQNWIVSFVGVSVVVYCLPYNLIIIIRESWINWITTSILWQIKFL